MNDLRNVPDTVNRDAQVISWPRANFIALRTRSFLSRKLISFWTRLQHSFHSRTVRRLRVRETLALGEKRQLLIVECGERQLLIGAAGNFLTMLAELPVGEPTRSSTSCE